MTSTQHTIDTMRGEDLRHHRSMSDCPVKRSKRRIAMMSMLATGHLPWGPDWTDPDGFACLPLCGGRYIMCCGHVMQRREAQLFVDHGLLVAGPSGLDGRPTLVITEAGRAWLAHNW